MKTFTLEATRDKHLFRVVDRDGNWDHYAYLEKAPRSRAPDWKNIKGEILFFRGATGILKRGYAKGKGFEEWLLGITPAERDQILNDTGERGDKVHRFIDHMLETSRRGRHTFDRTMKIYSKRKKDIIELSNDEWDCILSFEAFWKAHEPVLYSNEFPAFDFGLEVAGSGDAILEITKTCGGKTCPCSSLIGKVGVIDWKTTGAIRSEHSAQVGFYASCRNILDYIPKSKFIEYTGIVRVGTRHRNGGFEFKAFDAHEGLERFRAAKTIDDFDYKPFDLKKVEEIQDAVDVLVRRTPPRRAKQPLPAEKELETGKAALVEKMTQKSKKLT